MPGMLASRRRAFNTRGRGGSTSRRRVIEDQQDALSEPPRKRRKYVPGGPGGGGHFQDREGQATSDNKITNENNFTSRREGRSLRNIGTTGTTTPSERPNRPRRERRAPQQEPLTRPRYSSAAAAAAAAVQGDGFKPREERGWEEFHEHLEIDAKLPVFASGLVDGTVKPAEDENGDLSAKELDQDQDQDQDMAESATIRRRPGRPPRSQSAMLKGIGNIETPRAVPIPGPNPREKLTLPRPSFKEVDPFISYEKANGSIDYVDRSMANLGYQESDHFDRPDRGLIRWSEDNVDEETELLVAQNGEHPPESSLPRVEYDMDEQDQKWLESYNAWRKTEGAEPLKPAYFEITLTKIEKEWHALEKRIPKPNPKPPQTHRPRSSSAAAVNGEPVPDGEEQDTKCAICDDGDCENTNAIVFCDGCDLAVHQECYGVPFIPEGQWLCRKCHLIGSGTPTCVFCPNTDGAFKQTNSARWAHLLCAIWIPEVSLGNTTFMDPVMDVEKVPKSRWRLTCDICKQKMGACIQCSHKACYTAFHVTCAKRARWYVSMKSNQGGSANLDSNMLRAYCGNHVSEEWAQTYNTHHATKMARKYYKKAMRGKIWADSHQTAQSLQAIHMPSTPPPAQPVHEEILPKITLSLGGSKKKKNQPTGKSVWKLPSGAPVIPASLFSLVDTALLRFSLRKRREFVADMCKYWTLKREAKRGAALIKRLQLQMETFSAMEITRRNFASMGAIGRGRLQRRIDFAEERIRELDAVRDLCSLLKDREEKKLQNAELLRDVVDTVYFPIPSLLWSALEKAERHDIKEIFKNGLSHIRQRLEQRGYASVIPISADLGSVFLQILSNNTIDAAQFATTSSDDVSGKKSVVDEKAKRAIAKRILKAIQPTLEDALRKESELNQMLMEDTLLDLGQLLEKSLQTRRPSGGSLTKADSAVQPATEDLEAMELDIIPQNRITSLDDDDDDTTKAIPVDNTALLDSAPDGPTAEDVTIINTTEVDKPTSPSNHLTPSSIEAAQLDEIDPPAPVHDLTSHETNHAEVDLALQPQQAPTPPLSTNSSHLPPQQVVVVHAPNKITPLSLGGVPWYMQDFKPSGLTFQDEVRNDEEAEHTASEELSEIDDDEFDDIAMEVDASEAAAAQQASSQNNTRARNKGGNRARRNGRGKGRAGGRSRVSR